MHRVVAIACMRWENFESSVSGDKGELLRASMRDEEAKHDALVARHDLDEAVRKKTGAESRPIECAVLERDDTINVTPKKLAAH